MKCIVSNSCRRLNNLLSIRQYNTDTYKDYNMQGLRVKAKIYQQILLENQQYGYSLDTTDMMDTMGINARTNFQNYFY